MNKRLIALAVLATTGAAAMAQSSVTLWGAVDLGVAHTMSSGNSVNTMTTGGYEGWNKLGFKGVEDLGGGNGAAFWLESGYTANNGNGAAAGGGLKFDRRSTVSLTGNWGELRVGRDFTVGFENYVLGDPFGDSSIAGGADNLTYFTGHGKNNGINNNAAYWVNNAIKYSYGFGANDSTWGFGSKGLYAELQYALPGTTSGTPSVGEYLGGRLGYAVGGFNGAVAYTSSTGVGNLSNIAGVKFTEFNIAAQYDMGVATLIASGGQNNNNDTVGGSNKFTHYTLGAQIPAGPGYIPVAFNSVQNNGVGGTTANLFGLGYVYNLSKHTHVYGMYSHIKNGANTDYGVGGANTDTFAPASFVVNGGAAVNSVQLGLAHSF